MFRERENDLRSQQKFKTQMKMSKDICMYVCMYVYVCITQGNQSNSA